MINKPEMTFPEEEALLVRKHYSKANTILEYGMGGSTVFAAGMEHKKVYSVENSASWFRMMQEYFDQNKPLAELQMHYVDVGEVKKWGRPKDDSGWRNYHKYPLSVWDIPEFVSPDVVLIDGRFRVGCFFATIFRCAKPATILFDDYVNRKQYHIVERFAEIKKISGRMAQFEIKPQSISAKDLATITHYLNSSF